MKEACELVFIPNPNMGHLLSTVQIATLLADKAPRLSTTVLLMKSMDPTLNSHIQSLTSSSSDNSDSRRIKFITLPENDFAFKSDQSNPNTLLTLYLESHKHLVRDCVKEIISLGSVRLAGLVVDMFCTAMIDVANEFGVPSYVFYTSGAAMLGLHLHLQSLRDDHGEDVTSYKNSEDANLNVSTYGSPFPAKLLPSIVLDREGGSEVFLDGAKRIREVNGVMVNTFFELESHAIESLSDDSKIPPVYPVGPILNLEASKDDNEGGSKEKILKWLDDQPDASVVFLCFGSWGFFPEEQVKEIARALENSGHRFLWALRQSPPVGSFFPVDNYNLEDVLPKGFLQRTEGVGMVIGWAPQVAVLGHPAVGAFVSHCGWNSTLESIWFGKPIATWPIYAEQQANAFQLVKDIGVAMEIKMDYKKDFKDVTTFPDTVKADEIERGIRGLMDPNNPKRLKAKEIGEKSRMARAAHGSSYTFLERFIEGVFNNLK